MILECSLPGYVFDERLLRFWGGSPDGRAPMQANDKSSPTPPTESIELKPDAMAAFGAAPCSAILGFMLYPELPHEWSYETNHDQNSIVLPWLNLLFLSPELASMRDQSRWVARPTVKKQVYGILCESKFGQKLKKLEERLRHIYPDSFLFRLSPQQIEYRNVLNGLLTIRDFVEYVHQILCVDFADRPVGEICREQFVRKSYSQIPEQIRHNNRREIDDALGELSERGLCLEDSLWTMDDGYLPNDPSSATAADKKGGS